MQNIQGNIRRVAHRIRVYNNFVRSHLDAEFKKVTLAKPFKNNKTIVKMRSTMLNQRVCRGLLKQQQMSMYIEGHNSTYISASAEHGVRW